MAILLQFNDTLEYDAVKLGDKLLCEPQKLLPYLEMLRLARLFECADNVNDLNCSSVFRLNENFCR